MNDVVITGIGVVLPNCDTKETLWQHLSRGESQLRKEPNPAYPAESIAVGRVWDFDPSEYLAEMPERFFRRYDREVQIYLASLMLARDDANISLESIVPERFGILDGCSRPGFAGWYRRIVEQVTNNSFDGYSSRDLMGGTPGLAAGIAASLFEARGSVYTFNSTCSSGAVAIGQAFREIQQGRLDVALATGHEAALCPPLFAMYRDGQLLSSEVEDPKRAVRPYSDCIGNAFGEGSITLVLESASHARARGAKAIARIRSYWYGNNGFHPTTPDLAGGQPARLILSALRDAGMSVDDIGFIVGHGNGVQLSDSSEENYMLLLLGERAHEVPLVSNKPIYGHTLGASSALNVATTALMLKHNYVIPTINVNKARANEAFDHMAGEGRNGSGRAGITVSFGLGGNNTVLLLDGVTSP